MDDQNQSDKMFQDWIMPCNKINNTQQTYKFWRNIVKHCWLHYFKHFVWLHRLSKLHICIRWHTCVHKPSKLHICLRWHTCDNFPVVLHLQNFSMNASFRWHTVFNIKIFFTNQINFRLIQLPLFSNSNSRVYEKYQDDYTSRGNWIK